MRRRQRYDTDHGPSERGMPLLQKRSLVHGIHQEDFPEQQRFAAIVT
jgi:hypothetical protein